MELKQSLKMSQQLVMTPQLQMAIKLLQLNRLELLDTLSQELQENPVLEEMPGDPEQEEKQEIDVTESEVKDIGSEWYLEDYQSGPTLPNFREERSFYKNDLTRKTSLTDHLLWQLRLSDFPQEEQKIGALIITNLDDNGYLQATLEEIAEGSSSELPLVVQVLKKIQEFDPVGVASRDLKECLLIQARYLGVDSSLVNKIIENHLKELENKNYQEISRELNVSLEEVLQAAKLISQMEPKPGRSFGGEEPHYIIPDLEIRKVGEEYVVVMNADGLPKLKLNSFYQKLLKDKGRIEKTEREYIQNRLQSAIWLIKSINQRENTIRKVAESIVKFQREFFDKGINYLRPLVLRDVAADVSMHESTVSRVTRNKYAHTPQGIYELKFFFTGGLSLFDGNSIASESVKTKLMKVIAQENPRKPYSDQQLAEILKDSDINIARRTVTKYREMMRILPSSKRKKII
ncbi:MAG: RNA polymerase factor sigma-54 [Deltaproteobacteria bacterium]|nr:MAG: RNA polymerase factor sigma-54 [Deltaproteobacteria bacterium]